MAARQKALAAAYPEEYVVLVGDRVLVHTQDKEEAFARYDAAVEQGGEEPIVIPPGALRQTPPPVLRGRGCVRRSRRRPDVRQHALGAGARWEGQAGEAA
jgi:hypothetical protein